MWQANLILLVDCLSTDFRHVNYVKWSKEIFHNRQIWKLFLNIFNFELFESSSWKHTICRISVLIYCQFICFVFPGFLSFVYKLFVINIKMYHNYNYNFVFFAITENCWSPRWCWCLSSVSTTSFSMQCRTQRCLESPGWSRCTMRCFSTPSR